MECCSEGRDTAGIKLRSWSPAAGGRQAQREPGMSEQHPLSCRCRHHCPHSLRRSCNLSMPARTTLSVTPAQPHSPPFQPQP